MLVKKKTSVTYSLHSYQENVAQSAFITDLVRNRQRRSTVLKYKAQSLKGATLARDPSRMSIVTL